MKLETLCLSAGLETPSDTRMAACDICAIAYDSRTVVPGCLFVCIRGTKVDGHAYIGEAIRKGAAAVLTQRDADVTQMSGPIFLSADDTRRALARLYDAWYGHPAAGMTLIAVTGTNGKTSVSTMLKAMFDAALIPCGLIGTVQCVCREHPLNVPSRNKNANMTTPDPSELYHMLALMRDDGVRVVVMEATSHALALQKLEPLHFAAAIFTNLTPEHLDFHHTMQQYFAAKASLFPEAELAILNVDDPAAKSLLPYCHGKVVRTSAGAHDADYAASDVSFRGVDGVAYTLRSSRAVMKLSSPIPGVFTVSNTLQAAACALEMGVSARCIRESLNTLTGVAGRMERVRLGVPVDFTVFVDYAHTPDALENLLRTAQGFRSERQRIVLLFGCGGDRDKSKRAAMGSIASRLADMVYVTADNSRSEDPQAIISDIVAGIDKEKPCRVIPDRATAIELAIRSAAPGDIILLAGKGHETYEIDATGRHPFDEKEIAAAAAERAFPRGAAHTPGKPDGKREAGDTSQ